MPTAPSPMVTGTLGHDLGQRVVAALGEPAARELLEVLERSDADHRVRLDPLDPATFRHAPHCEHRDTTDPAIVKAILRVHVREDYWWVECSACCYGWQVQYYGAESVG